MQEPLASLAQGPHHRFQANQASGGGAFGRALPAWHDRHTAVSNDNTPHSVLDWLSGAPTSPTSYAPWQLASAHRQPWTQSARSLTDRFDLDGREVLEDRHFHLVYQPIVRFSDRKIMHYEALARLSAEAAGPVRGTGDFTAQIEALGLAPVFDLAVISKALAVLRARPDVRIAVNVSGDSLQSPRFRAELLRRIGWTSRLSVEVTETAEIADLSAAAATLQELRQRGVQVCLDDFGSGHAAFRYLRELPIDFLKIDGSYVQAALNVARERDVLSAMCGMARAVGAEVIAEQVETEAQAALMREMGIPLGQGWLLGHPGALA